MAVQFILGRSGTGKTSCCVSQIVDCLLQQSPQPLLLLVPEQATYQAERAILNGKKIAGYNGLRVLSFERLGFLLSGRYSAGIALSTTARQMIIQRILQEHKDELKIFASAARQGGFAKKIAEIIAELYQYSKTTDDIDALLGELKKENQNSITSLKFEDIGLIFREYLNFIEGRFIEPQAELNNVRSAIAEADFIKGAKLWVDGFSGFTGVELAVLAELMKAAAETKIALCLDAASFDLKKPDTGKIDPTDLFGSTQRTYSELFEMVKSCQLRLAEPEILEKAVRFSGNRQLAHIERNIFTAKAEKMAASENVQIISAPNVRSEVEFVACEILKLVKEKKYRYRDIAVIAADIDNYQHYIKAYFDDYELPFFIDQRKPLNHHPVIQFICSALQIITSGFSHSDIFSYLKTDIVSVQRGDVDLLENYCIAFGTSSADWSSEKKWLFAAKQDTEFAQQKINEIRFKVSRPLLKLKEKLCPKKEPQKEIAAEEFVRIILDFLAEFGISEKISDWIEQAEKTADKSTADEHRQFYEKLLGVFDEFAEIFSGSKNSCENYFAIINSVFSQLTLGFIPQALDEVLIGSIERSRHPDLKAVFLIGATQKQFPVALGSNSILTDYDRAAADEMDFSLAEGATQQITLRQYLTYIAFTRPSEMLYVTYPAADENGSAIVRSGFINNLESLFENLKEKSVSERQTKIEKIHSRSELAELLCSRLGKDVSGFENDDSGKLNELLDDVCRDEQFSAIGETVKSAINYDNSAKLAQKVADEFFAEQIKISATKLSTFAACPYKYFARYILKIRKRKQAKLEPLDIGKFEHAVLDSLLKRLNSEKKDFAEIDNEKLLKILNEQISKIIQSDSFVSNFIRRSSHNNFIINSAGRILEDCTLAMAEMIRAGDFRPLLSEVSFGEKGKWLGEYEIPVSKDRKIFLTGKIDRIDVAEMDGKKAVIIFDYKRKEKSFGWSQLYYGLDMQLAIYILAVRSAADAEMKNAIGAFYLPIEISPQKAALDELQKKKQDFNYKAKGIFNGEFFRQLDNSEKAGWNKFYNFQISSKGDQYSNYVRSGALKPDDFENVLRFTEKKIVELTQQMFKGKIDIKPYRLGGQSPCSYCEYKPLCRFDWQLNDYNYLIPVNGKNEVVKKTNV